MKGQIDTPPESYCLVLNHPPEIKNLSALVKVSPFQSCIRMKGEGRGRVQKGPLPKIRHIYPTVMTLKRKEDPKKYKPLNTSL